jgi:hypothetical protein
MAITVATGWPKTTFTSNMRQIHYKLSVGVTADQISIPGIGHIVSVVTSPNNGITNVAATDRSGATKAYLTFTGTGNNVFVTVTGA